MMLVPSISKGARNSIRKDTRRTARPTLNANFTLLLSSFAKSHTLHNQALQEENRPMPPSLLVSGRLDLVAAGGMLV